MWKRRYRSPASPQMTWLFTCVRPRRDTGIVSPPPPPAQNRNCFSSHVASAASSKPAASLISLPQSACRPEAAPYSQRCRRWPRADMDLSRGVQVCQEPWQPQGGERWKNSPGLPFRNTSSWQGGQPYRLLGRDPQQAGGGHDINPVDLRRHTCTQHGRRFPGNGERK